MKKPELPPKVKESPTYTEIIHELIKLQKFREFFKIDDTEYPYWEEWKYKTKTWGIYPEKIWSCAKTHRRGGRKFYFSSIQGFEFQLNVPIIIQQYLHELDMNLGGNLQSESIIPSEEKDRYLISSIMEEAIASSQLEGAVTTRKVARELLEKDKKPQNRSERMISNNYDTMRWIVQNKDQKLTPEVLLSIHSSITKDTLEDKGDEGAFRNNDDITVNEDISGEVFYIPPSYQHIDQLIKDFCVFANDEDKDNVFVHPIIKGIILHFLIGYIHPFTDGNGRTARAIFYWYLIRKGYWLIEYMSVSRIILKAKSQYARAYLYSEYDDNDLTYFVLYNIKAIKAALEDLKKYIRKKTEEKQNTLALVKHTSFNDRQIVLIKDILQDRNQYFTVKQIELRFNVSNQTARTDLITLAEKGILQQRTIGRKAQFFATDDFEKKIERQKMKKLHGLILFFTIFIADLVAVQLNYKIAEYIFKPLIVIWLLAYFVLQTKLVRNNLKKWIIAALLFSWLGDVLLMLQDDNSFFFLLGLSAFLVAHVFYILFFHFIRVKENVKSRWWLLLIVVLYYLILISLLSPHLGDMKLPVRIYAIVISFMFMLAMHMSFIKYKKAGRWMMLGALLFVISDSILAINKFYQSFEMAGIVVMLTYGLAQLFITEAATRYILRDS